MGYNNNNSMMKIWVWSIALLGMFACTAQNKEEMKDLKVVKTDKEWKKELTAEQYFILRESGTEAPGSGKFNLYFEDGSYSCAGCGEVLFDSESKFNSHCGWPSFDRAAADGKVVEILDKSHGMTRTEIRCASCGGHLGHVFNDGPTETGLRYCINSAALDFENDTKEEGEASNNFEK